MIAVIKNRTNGDIIKTVNLDVKNIKSWRSLSVIARLLSLIGFHIDISIHQSEIIITSNAEHNKFTVNK